jgi:hypothetical protein
MKRYLVLMIFVFLFFPVKMVMAYEYTANVSLSLSEEYNDNIFLAHSNRDSDFITHVSPSMDLSIKSLKSELRLGYSPTFSYYSSYNELNNTAHRFTANGLFNLSDRLSLTLTDTFVKSSEIPDIRAIPDLGPLTARVELRLNTVSGNISYRLTDNLSYILGASYFDTDYKEPGFIDVKTYSGNMGFSYRSSERTTLSANAKYIKYNFRTVTYVTEQDYMLGVTHRLTPTLTVGATGGATITNVESINKTDTSFSGSLDFTKTFEKGQAVLSFRRAVIAGVETGGTLRDQTVRLSFSMPLSNKWTASVSGSYGNSKSIGTSDFDTDVTSLNTDLTYSFGPWVSLALSYNFVNYDDKIIAAGDYYNHIIFLTLRLNYSKRL